MRRDDIRNLVIIAHVDHGKTTLVDCLLRQSCRFRENELKGDQILDTGELEKERGITILAKNIALTHNGVKINIIDTPGHADFGGEVERVVRMADGALLLVDAAEGPMPQTRFVLSKALEAGLKPIIVINKIDRSDARIAEVVDETHALLMELGMDQQLDDVPCLFSSALAGHASTDMEVIGTSMTPLLDMVLDSIPGPDVQPDDPLQMLITTLDWSEFVGRIAIGRVQSGIIRQNQGVELLQADDAVIEGKVARLYVFDNLGRQQVDSATAGDIVAVEGLDQVEIGDTICQLGERKALPRLSVDRPTLEMIFSINTSPFAGQEGKYVTTRQLRERLLREIESNVALTVKAIEGSDAFAVAGRGVLHLSVLIETMRREGYEFSVAKPRVINRSNNGTIEEPCETLNIEVPSDRLGAVMELVGQRRGAMLEMTTRGEFTHVSFSIPARGLIGLRTRLLNATHGTVVVHHRFDRYRPMEGDVPRRANGVMVSTSTGRAVAFALNGLQQRAEMFVGPGDSVYEGMIVGENSRENDMAVNPMKEKKLSNMRAAGTDDNIILKPPRRMSLESALEYVEDDELLEITPTSFRLRKRLLREAIRRREERRGN
jgi:GTP-binding protein